MSLTSGTRWRAAAAFGRSRADLATLRADIYRAMLIQTAATIGGTVALLRLLD